MKHIHRDKQDSEIEVNGNINTKMEKGEYDSVTISGCHLTTFHNLIKCINRNYSDVANGIDRR